MPPGARGAILRAGGLPDDHCPAHERDLGLALGWLFVILSVLTFFVAVFLPPTLFWPLLGAAWGACVLAAAWLWRADRAGALGFAGAAVLGPLLLAAYWVGLRVLTAI